MPDLKWSTTLAPEFPIDRGISYVLKVLRDAGVETFESCEGGEGHAFTVPSIRFHGDRGAGFTALSIAISRSLPVAELCRQWPVIEGEPTGPHWLMTFHKDALLRLQASAERARQIE